MLREYWTGKHQVGSQNFILLWMRSCDTLLSLIQTYAFTLSWVGPITTQKILNSDVFNVLHQWWNTCKWIRGTQEGIKKLSVLDLHSAVTFINSRTITCLPWETKPVCEQWTSLICQLICNISFLERFLRLGLAWIKFALENKFYNFWAEYETPWCISTTVVKISPRGITSKNGKTQYSFNKHSAKIIF